MSKILSAPQTGKIGNVVNLITRYGQVQREFVPPPNTRAPDQQAVRGKLGRVAAHWRTLRPDQRAAWCIAACSSYIINRLGRKTALNGYNYYMRVNCSRAILGLSLFDLPPAVPGFNPNPVGELVITNQGSEITLKLHVLSLPAEYTIVQGAAPCSAGISFVLHVPFLGFLPPPIDGWSDITALYVARYGVPPVGLAVFIRTHQHIDGWNDLPIETSAIVPPA